MMIYNFQNYTQKSNKKQQWKKPLQHSADRKKPTTTKKKEFCKKNIVHSIV